MEYDGRELVEPSFRILELDIVLIPLLKFRDLGMDLFYRIQLLKPSNHVLFPMELDFQVLDSLVVCLFDDVSRSGGMSVTRIVFREGVSSDAYGGDTSIHLCKVSPDAGRMGREMFCFDIESRCGLFISLG